MITPEHRLELLLRACERLSLWRQHDDDVLFRQEVRLIHKHTHTLLAHWRGERFRAWLRRILRLGKEQ